VATYVGRISNSPAQNGILRYIGVKRAEECAARELNGSGWNPTPTKGKYTAPNVGRIRDLCAPERSEICDRPQGVRSIRPVGTKWNFALHWGATQGRTGWNDTANLSLR